MTNIYQLEQDIELALDKYLYCFNEDWELVVNENNFKIIEKELEELQNKKSDFLEYLCKSRANNLASITWIDTEIKRLTEMKQGIEKKINKTEWFIEKIVKPLYNGKTINYGLFQVWFRKSKATIIEDESLIWDEYKKEKVSITIDKTAIKKDLEAWKNIKWARIEERENLNIK